MPLAISEKKREPVNRICYARPALLSAVKALLEDIPFEPAAGSLFGRPVGEGLQHAVLLLEAEFVDSQAGAIWNWVEANANLAVKIIVLSKTGRKPNSFGCISAELIYMVLPESAEMEVVAKAAENAFETLALTLESLQLESRLAMTYQDMRRLVNVGKALLSERNFDELIGLILAESREMVSADAGSIYVIERRKNNEKPTHLRFKKSALNLNTDEFLLAIDSNSLAGHVAFTGEPLIIDDAYQLPKNVPYHFNSSFDQQSNYYTKSMMVIPMKNHRNEVNGVIQLINRKKNLRKKLTIEEMRGGEVLAFDEKSYELASALAGQAAVAIENNILLADISNLFEGFVTASVTAIEQRDPTTSGHSFRVADLTVELAKKVDQSNDHVLRDIRFSAEQIREIRYASLLHDFGKVGVREEILVKAKKLFPKELELIEWRFNFIRRSLENEYLQKKFDHLRKYGNDGFDQFEAAMDDELQLKLAELQKMFQVILDSNEPSVLETGSFEFLQSIAGRHYQAGQKNAIPYLRPEELLSLSVRRGSLTQKERLDIESHVTHSYNFLIQIPWTTDLRNVPHIAHGHHEKLNGSGYPLGLKSEEIIIQARMMTISDIYDALTAWDRPYKKAISYEKALDILQEEAQMKNIDATLLKVFIEAGIYKLVYRETERQF